MHRRKEEDRWGNDAHARPGNCAVARLGGEQVLAFNLETERLDPVVVFNRCAHEATIGGTPIETIDEGELSALVMQIGHPVKINLRSGYKPGRNGVTSLVVKASV